MLILPSFSTLRKYGENLLIFDEVLSSNAMSLLSLKSLSGSAEIDLIVLTIIKSK